MSLVRADKPAAINGAAVLVGALVLAILVLLGAAAWQQHRASDIRARQVAATAGRWALDISSALRRQQATLDFLVLAHQDLISDLLGQSDKTDSRHILATQVASAFSGACGFAIADAGGGTVVGVALPAEDDPSCTRGHSSQDPMGPPGRGLYTLISTATAGAPAPRARVVLSARQLLMDRAAISPIALAAYLVERKLEGPYVSAWWPATRSPPADNVASLLSGTGVYAAQVPGSRWELLLQVSGSDAASLPIWELGLAGLLTFGLGAAGWWLLGRASRQQLERRQLTQALAETDQRLQSILDHTRSMIGVRDSQDRLLLANHALQKRLDLPLQQIVGNSISELFPSQMLDQLADGDQQVWREHTSLCTEETLHGEHWEGCYRWLRFPVPDAAGSMTALGFLATDITAERSAQAALEDSRARYQAVFDQVPDALLLVDPGDGRILEFSSAAHALLGYSRSEFEGLHLSDLEQAAGERSSLQQRCAQAEVEWQCETRFVTRGGEPRDVVVRGRRAAIGGRELVLVVARDVSEQKRAELSLKMLSGALDQSGSVVVISNRRGLVEYVNPRFTEVTGYDPDEVIGKPASMLRSPETPSRVVDEIRDAGRQHHKWRGELLNRRKSGERYWALISISPVCDENDEVTHYVTVGDDVTEIKETQFQMERLAFYDTLTGLANRQLFRERLEQVLRGATRNQRPAALLYLDLDRFKRVNDTLGHDAGDALLNAIGERLGQCVRKEDSVARLGGDEFTVLLAEVDGPAGAAVVARKILDALSESVRLAAQEVFVSASIGITLIPQDGIDATVLLKNADLAMYRAKDQGRNNYQFFRREMNEQAAERLMLENDLRRSFYRSELSLLYLPLVSRTTGQVVSLEALLRWQHPQRGLLAPGSFISVAEESGLIVPIGQWVLRTACSQIKALQEDGYPDIGVSVNLSARQFRDPNLVGSVQATLTGTGLEAPFLQLEITESLLMENLEEAIATLWELKEIGVSVYIDDFGVGYSSLSYLKRLPVDSLKVDRSFVQDIPADRDDMEITAAVIAMAHKLRLSVVAEGVETTEQLEFLEENHCDFYQGHLFSEPLPCDELRDFLRQFGEQGSPGLPKPGDKPV